jgi:pilus assembly protein Flp/PilA
MWSNINNLITTLFARVQLRREDGQGLVEYALILALVSIAVVTVLALVGKDIGVELTAVTSAL